MYVFATGFHKKISIRAEVKSTIISFDDALFRLGHSCIWFHTLHCSYRVVQW